MLAALVLAWPTEQLLHTSTVQDPGQGSATTSETRFTPTTLLLAAPIDALQRAAGASPESVRLVSAAMAAR